MAASLAGQLFEPAKLLSKFKGSLVAAVAGDCIGAYFEGQWTIDPEEVEIICDKMKKSKYDGKTLINRFTDDTAMARSVAASLIICKKMDIRDMSERFVEEYYKEPNRGYGGNVFNVFKELKDSGYARPHFPASQTFDGQGSYGNGAAMRIVPAALFGYDYTPDQLFNLVDDISKITHSHQDALTGAKLQCLAVQQALKANPLEDLDAASFLHSLRTEAVKMETPEKEVKRRPKRKSDEVAQPFTFKIGKMGEFLKEDAKREEIVDTFGNDISALGSVPTAIYCFLRSATAISDIKAESPVERTIKYAISLGGDTDTIATMAGAISGAYYGIDSVPHLWQENCEGVDVALEQAEQLLHIYTDKDS